MSDHDSYQTLASQFPLDAIRDEAHLEAAIATAHTLLKREYLDEAEEDYLDVLIHLIRAYEIEHYPELYPDEQKS